MSKLNVSVSRAVSASPGDCWARVGGWRTIHEWHPAIEKTEAEGDAVGAFRRLTLGDGAQIKEELTRWDGTERVYSYRFVEHPFPVDDYEGTIAVAGNDDGTSTITWSATLVPKGVSADEAREMFEGVYTAGLDAVRGEFEG